MFIAASLSGQQAGHVAVQVEIRALHAGRSLLCLGGEVKSKPGHKTKVWSNTVL